MIRCERTCENVDRQALGKTWNISCICVVFPVGESKEEEKIVIVDRLWLLLWLNNFESVPKNVAIYSWEELQKKETETIPKSEI